MRPIVIGSSEYIKRQLTVFSLGLLLGLLAAVAAYEYRPVEDESALRMCKLPDVENAMTVFVMDRNKIKCWRWK